jgi:hypothetical protein
MYLDEFAARLHQLEDPYTDIQTRHVADQWLTQFRDTPHSWSTAQSALSSPSSHALWPHAAQILAYKCKRQLTQIEAIEHRMALLQTLSAALATLSKQLSATATASSSSRAITQGLCVAISNLIIHLPTLPNPLEAIGSLLDQQVMLEFLTILPGECDDAYSALQASTASEASEAAFLLKQRSGEWCIEVGAWLFSNSSQGGDDGSSLFSAGQLPPLLVPSISCFAAWIKWGGLFFMQQEHWEYMLRLSSSLLLYNHSGSNNSQFSAAAAAAAAVGVEALSEAIERPAPATQRTLLEISLRIAQYISTIYPLGSTHSSSTISGGSASAEQLRQLTHVFTTYCSTNASIVAAMTSEGGLLRNGLLHLVAFAGEKASRGGSGSQEEADGEEADGEEVDEEEEESGGGVPAIDALGDVLEAIVDSSLASDLGTAINDQIIGGGGGNGDDNSNKEHPLLFGHERIQFTSTVLSVLLQYSQAPVLYLLPNSPKTTTAPAAAVKVPSRLSHFRTQAEWPLWLCGEILKADTFIHQLYTFFQTRSSTAEGTLQALEVCFYALHKGAAGAFSSSDDGSGSGIDPFSKIIVGQPPAWLGPLVSLYAAAQELDPSGPQQQGAAIQLTIFHYNLLSSFVTVAQPLMKALISMPEQCRGLMELIFTQALTAITATATAVKASIEYFSSIESGFDEEHSEHESVVEAAAQAVRAAVSSPTEVQAMALASGAVGAIDSMLAALTIEMNSPATVTAATAVSYKRRDSAGKKAFQQLLIALVHILHTEDQHAAATAQEVLRNRALQPLVTIAAATAASTAAAASNTSSSSHYAFSSASPQFMLLHASLEDTLALLNSLESHLDLVLLGSYTDHHGQRPVAAAAVADAVAACLTAWPNIITALSQASISTTTSMSNSSTTALCSLLYNEASQCLCSCINLAPTTTITPTSLTPLLESIYSTFFLPGGHSMHRILCSLLETTTSSEIIYSDEALFNQITTLVVATGSLFTHPQAQKFYSLGGGDADPETACALLTIATCLLRQAGSTRWNSTITTMSSPSRTGTITNSTAITPPNSTTVQSLVECVDLALRLAAANAACNHRGVCQRSIATLSAALVLILDTSCTALYRPLLQYTCTTSSSSTTGGVVIMQGIMLCLLSLYSLSFLPKIVNLMSDVATLATRVYYYCNSGSDGGGGGANVATVTHAATNMLQEWWNTARMNLSREGQTGGAGAGAGAAMAVQSEVLNSFNWQALVAAAASGHGLVEAKRGVQRAVRQLADQIRNKHGNTTLS